jgi:hypothetical protein
MTLTVIGWIFAGIAAGWLSLTLFIAYADFKLRLEDRQRMQTRDWQEKVDAMRRMQDQDGAA